MTVKLRKAEGLCYIILLHFGFNHHQHCWCLLYTSGDSDVISSYHMYASCFFHLDVGQTLGSVCYCDIAFLVR